jgi:DNA-binding NarL/FixJ family response regulator
MIRILAVCKAVRFIRFIEPHLEQYGIYFVHVCTNNEQAAHLYTQLHPDVVVLDANWASRPRAITSVELIVRLREINSSCKIIVATNMNEPDTVSRLKQYGINGYFYRNADNLIEVIAGCILSVFSGNTALAE